MKQIRVLFICKQRPTYGVSYGLLNSCKFLVNALVDMGFEAKVVEVVDNNSIDREVYNYKPTHVFIEALWVVPEKFDVLIPLYPNIKWYVRLHSNTPFLSNEGMAVEWLVKYFAMGVKYPQFKVAPNAKSMANDLLQTYGVQTVYAPNVYQPEESNMDKPPRPTLCPDPDNQDTVDIGCFGAIRPLKNQLLQAMAAIAFGNKLKKQITFHINSARIETNGAPILKNIQSLFASGHHKLEVHDWLSHDAFLELVRTMDLGLQVSFSETFNIVAADFVYENVPVVGSKEIEWLSPYYQASCTDLSDIVSHLEQAWYGKRFGLQVANRQGLKGWNQDARKIWRRLLNP